MLFSTIKLNWTYITRLSKTIPTDDTRLNAED